MPMKPTDILHVQSALNVISDTETMRLSNIDMTLGGRYIGDKLSASSRGLLETIREDYCRRRIAEQAFELEKRGVTLTLDFDIEIFREELTKDDFDV